MPHVLRAWAINGWGKNLDRNFFFLNSDRNLQYGPQAQFVRGIYALTCINLGCNPAWI